MVDNLTPKDRRKTMQAVKGQGTALERRLWSMLAGMHVCGWERNPRDIKGKPDVVFRKYKLAIFVDGCFWHGCPHCKRTLPESNSEYWQRKLDRNQKRDKENTCWLTENGWTVIRIWEHEMKSPKARCRIRKSIRKALKSLEITST
jgi:DNA mismatch endonuclease (patch repair protein)